MSESDDTKALLQKYRELHVQRKSTPDAAQRMRITRELTDLEGRIRSSVKANPVPEPVGMNTLKKIAEQMTTLGFGIFANRLLGQHLRHPVYVPFESIDQVREYISAHLDDSALSKIPELNPKKKRFGLF